MYFRLGHVNKIYVKVGDRIKDGKLVATNGTGGGIYPAHCHFDIFKKKQNDWGKYNIGWTKNHTLEVWSDPRKYIKKVMPSFDRFGWRWLQWAIYKSGACWHPGVDLNGKGVGNADFDAPLYSPVDGVIEAIEVRKGWGKILIIKEEKMSDCIPVDNDLKHAIEKITGDDYGKVFTKKEQERAAKDLLGKFENCGKVEDTPETLEKLRKAEEELKNDRKTFSEARSKILTILGL